MIRFEIPEIDLGTTLDYSKLHDVFESPEIAGNSAENVFGAVGRLGMIKKFIDIAPDAYGVLLDATSVLDQAGVIVLHNTEVEKSSEAISQLRSITISCVYGEPTRTDQKVNRIAWPIKYDASTKLKRTFSQSLGEAAMHTDTQYFKNPEKYFGLYCVHADYEGQGTNQLIDGLSILQSFEEEYGPAAVKQLQMPFPFRVPSVFTKSASDSDIEITWAPIHDPMTGHIRYRKDTIMEALHEADVEISDEQLQSVELFDSHLSETEPISYHLKPGDAIIVDNHRMLHARTAFNNPERFLYRVRMNPDASI